MRNSLFIPSIFILVIVVGFIFLPWLLRQQKEYQAVRSDIAASTVAKEKQESAPRLTGTSSNSGSPFQAAILPHEENSSVYFSLEPEKKSTENKILTASSANTSVPAVSNSYTQSQNKVIKFPIFNYHNMAYLPADSTVTQKAFNVTPELFEQHLKYFKENGYQTVLLDDLIENFDTDKPLPAKAIAITFDDGHAGQYTYAFPLLKQYGFRATFFIVTDWANHPGYMTWDQIKEINDAGMVIGSHTLDHFNMTALSAERLKRETEESKKILEEKTWAPVNYLAYPGGSYNQQVIQAVIAAGYKGALSVHKVIEQSPKNRYVISRFHADDNMESIISKLGDY